MKDSMQENSGDHFHNSDDEDITLDQNDLAGIENKARSLMLDILNVRQDLNLLTFQVLTPDDNLQLQVNGLKEKLLRLCRVLIIVKTKLTQHMQAMENNVQILENQNLNTIEAGIEIIRSVELASIEVKRLKQLLDEIEGVLAQSEEVISHPVTQSFTPSLQRIPPYLMEKHDQHYDVDRILIDLEKAPAANSEYSITLNPTCSGGAIDSPMLQAAPLSGLNNTLSKIPTPSTNQVNICADPYDGGLYVQDAYLGRTNLQYEPHDPIMGQMALSARLGTPIMGEVGFDGNYCARTHEGVTIPLQSDQFGNDGDI